MAIALLFGLGTSLACALDPAPKKAIIQLVESVTDIAKGRRPIAAFGRHHEDDWATAMFFRHNNKN